MKTFETIRQKTYDSKNETNALLDALIPESNIKQNMEQDLQRNPTKETAYLKKEFIELKGHPY